MYLLVLPILAGIFTGVTETIYKSVTEKRFSSATYPFLWDLIATAITLPLFVTHFSISSNLLAWLAFFFALFSNVAAIVCLFAAYKSEDISNIALLSKCGLVFTMLFGLSFFNELISEKKIFGVFIMIVGAVAIFYEKKTHNFSNTKGLLLALASAFFYSLSAVGSKYTLKYFDAYFYIFLMYLGLTFSLSFFPNVKKEAKIVFGLRKKRFIIAGFLGVTAYFLTLITFRDVNLSIGYPVVASTSLIISVLLGISILREVRHIPNKIAGSILMIVGIFLFG